MERSAVHVQASDGASHYLWFDRLPGHVFLNTVATLLTDEATAAAAQKDQLNGGWWLWKHVVDHFTITYGGRAAGLMTGYVPFMNVAYLPLITLDGSGHTWLEDITGSTLSSPLAFRAFGESISEVLRAEPRANLAVVLDYLLVDEEI